MIQTLSIFRVTFTQHALEKEQSVLVSPLDLLRDSKFCYISRQISWMFTQQQRRLHSSFRKTWKVLSLRIGSYATAQKLSVSICEAEQCFFKLKNSQWDHHGQKGNCSMCMRAGVSKMKWMRSRLEQSIICELLEAPLGIFFPKQVSEVKFRRTVATRSAPRYCWPEEYSWQTTALEKHEGNGCLRVSVRLAKM